MALRGYLLLRLQVMIIFNGRRSWGQYGRSESALRVSGWMGKDTLRSLQVLSTDSAVPEISEFGKKTPGALTVYLHIFATYHRLLPFDLILNLFYSVPHLPHSLASAPTNSFFTTYGALLSFICDCDCDCDGSSTHRFSSFLRCRWDGSWDWYQ